MIPGFKRGNTEMKRIFLALIIGCAFGTASAADCPAGRSTPINDGHFGAKNVRAYNTMISLQRRGRIENIREMIEGGTVIKLPGDGKACVLRDVVTSSRTQVSVPGHEGTFWVHASALERSQDW